MLYSLTCHAPRLCWAGGIKPDTVHENAHYEAFAGSAFG